MSESWRDRAALVLVARGQVATWGYGRGWAVSRELQERHYPVRMSPEMERSLDRAVDSGLVVAPESPTPRPPQLTEAGRGRLMEIAPRLAERKLVVLPE